MTNLEIYLTEPGVLRITIESEDRRCDADISLAQHLLPWCVREVEGTVWLEDLDGAAIERLEPLDLPKSAYLTVAQAAIACVIETGGLAFPGGDGHESRKVFVVAYAAYKNGVEAARKALKVIRDVEAAVNVRDTEFWFPVTHKLNAEGIISQAALIASQPSAVAEINTPSTKEADNQAKTDLHRELDAIAELDDAEERRDLFEKALYNAYHTCICGRPDAKHMTETALERQCRIMAKAHTRVVFDYGFTDSDPEYAPAINEQYMKFAMIEMKDDI